MKIKEVDKQPLSPGLRTALAIISHAVVFADADRPRRDAQIGTDACKRITRHIHSTLSLAHRRESGTPMLRMKLQIGIKG